MVQKREKLNREVINKDNYPLFNVFLKKCAE